VEGHLVAIAVLDVTVEAVVGGVQLAVSEPLVVRRVRLVQRVLERLRPVEQLPGLLGPPSDGILRSLLVDRLIIDQGLLDELLGRVEQLAVEKLSELLLELLPGGLGAGFQSSSRCRFAGLEFYYPKAEGRTR
jgi:hypothetical protein